MEVFEAIRSRCSVRQFKPEVIPDEDIRRILEAARWAPSPFNTQPWEFIIITDKETLKAISKYARYSGYLADAPMAIAVVVPPLSNKFSWVESIGEPKFAAAKAVQNMMLAAWELGIGSCMVSIERDRVGEILGVPKTHFVLTVVPFGYPETAPAKHEDSFRKKLEEMVFYEKYGKKDGLK
ncbi:MAG: nitroreductase family protein [Candidatus Methanoperedens sp.]|nr:nitroreductase family protein [Candidatus Methanoperedens sp.]